MELELNGLHHVSAITAHISATHDFYRSILGMRPLIRTVNQDDTSMYHMFYGDGAGSPGSDMTWFDIPNAIREKRGSGSVTRTSLRVNGAHALEWWAARFDELGVTHSIPATVDARAVLDFEDNEGTPFRLVDDAGAGDGVPWDASPVPPQYQVRGLGYSEITVPELGPTDRFLRAGLGLHYDRAYTSHHAAHDDTHVYVMGAGGVHAEIHVVERPELQRVRPGAGGVHHVALRVPDRAQLEQWIERLAERDHPNSGIIDRHYFMSIYVREPNHVLFELATDGPGFAADGPLDAERLSLPPFLEPRRAAIEARLKPL